MRDRWTDGQTDGRMDKQSEDNIPQQLHCAGGLMKPIYPQQLCCAGDIKTIVDKISEFWHDLSGTSTIFS